MINNGYSREKIIDILKIFHSQTTVDEIIECMENGKNPFDRYVLHCDGKCEGSCFLKKYCYQKRVQELFELISEKSKELKDDSYGED